MNSLHDALNRQPYTRARNDRRISGVVIALVTDNDDPDGLGRVKLRYPWLSENNESGWAKVVSFMAGNSMGALFIPDIDTEVLVAFEHGDINYPYVLGGLWNRTDTPPEGDTSGNNNIRMIKSRSGHQILFNDDAQSGQEKLEIRSNGGHDIVLDDTSGSEMIEIKDKNDNKITFDSASNSITIESTTSLKLSAQTIEIEAGATLSLKANGVLTIEGQIVNIN